MRKVLIITEVFPPAFNPRMGYLVKYLPVFGWDADIITINTLKDNNYEFLVGKNKISRVNLKNSDTPHDLMTKIWRFLNLKRRFKSNKKPFLKEIKLNFRKDEYQVILVSVSWELYVLDAGLTVSRDWNIPFVVDMRDILEQKPLINTYTQGIKSTIDRVFTNSFEKMKFQLRNRILENADAVTTVSPYHVETLSSYNPNTTLIYNGYDSDLFNPDCIEKTQKFYVIYTGIVLDENEQDPTMLFEAVSQLENNRIIDEERFKIQFFTPAKFRSAIIGNRYFPIIEKYIEFFDYIDYREVPRLLRKASIALVLTNLSGKTGPKGVTTTKLFDYIGAERPVLCVRSDQDIIESIINKASIGVSARTSDTAYNFILGKWNEWKEKGYTTAKVNLEYKQQFTRVSQAKQFVEVLNKVIL